MGASGLGWPPQRAGQRAWAGNGGLVVRGASGCALTRLYLATADLQGDQCHKGMD